MAIKAKFHQTKRDRRQYGEWPPKEVNRTAQAVGRRGFIRRAKRAWKNCGGLDGSRLPMPT